MAARDVEKLLVDGFMRAMGDMPGFKALIDVAPSGMRLTYTLEVDEGPDDRMTIGPVSVNLLQLGGEKGQEGAISRIVKTTAAVARPMWETRALQRENAGT